MAKDLQSYSVVENVGCRNMIHNLEPRYVIPSRKPFAEVVVPLLYNEVVIEVKESLRGAKRVALTCDGWTSRATESYFTVTSRHALVTDNGSNMAVAAELVAVLQRALKPQDVARLPRTCNPVNFQLISVYLYFPTHLAMF